MTARACHRRPAFLAGLVLVGATLAGCGFTPLYATPGVTGALAGVAVDPPPHSRTGYLLRQQLDDQLGRDPGQPPTYRLALTVDERRFPAGVRVNNVASRYEVDLSVGYTLTEAATGRVLLTGSAPVRVSYDSADSPYAGVAAEQDGADRAANQAAVLIRLQLSRWLNGAGQAAGGRAGAAP